MLLEEVVMGMNTREAADEKLKAMMKRSPTERIMRALSRGRRGFSSSSDGKTQVRDVSVMNKDLDAELD